MIDGNFYQLGGGDLSFYTLTQGTSVATRKTLTLSSFGITVDSVDDYSVVFSGIKDYATDAHFPKIENKTSTSFDIFTNNSTSHTVYFQILYKPSSN